MQYVYHVSAFLDEETSNLRIAKMFTKTFIQDFIGRFYLKDHPDPKI